VKGSLSLILLRERPYTMVLSHLPNCHLHSHSIHTRAMDLLDRLRSRTNDLARTTDVEGVRAAIRHIQAAERHYQRASEEGDEEALNDVIYRTNQAFEGMLKEAFGVLSSSDGNKKSPYEIEKHLLEKNVLTERVLVLFKNYRQEWRNPSTHNHLLFFDEQEALLAIVSVSAFANILLDQIVEAENFAAEQRMLAETPPAIDTSVSTKVPQPFSYQVAHMLGRFARSRHVAAMSEEGAAGGRQSEFALVGQISAFLKTVAPDIEIAREPLLGEDRGLRPDIIVRRGTESTVVEIKATSPGSKSIMRGIEQLRAYVTVGDFSDGILFFASQGGYTDVSILEMQFETTGISRTLRIVSSDAASSTYWFEMSEYWQAMSAQAKVEVWSST